MIKSMKPGSIIVDLAAETGGNVEGAVSGSDEMIHGIRVMGASNYPGEVAECASLLFGNNVLNFIESYFEKESKEFKLNLEDEIIKGCLMTHQGVTVNEMYLNITKGK